MATERHEKNLLICNNDRPPIDLKRMTSTEPSVKETFSSVTVKA